MVINETNLPIAHMTYTVYIIGGKIMLIDKLGNIE